MESSVYQSSSHKYGVDDTVSKTKLVAIGNNTIRTVSEQTLETHFKYMYYLESVLKI